MKKSKRNNKIVFQNSYTKFEDCPITIIDGLLKKQSWFKGTTNIDDKKSKFEQGCVSNMLLIKQISTCNDKISIKIQPYEKSRQDRFEICPITYDLKRWAKYNHSGLDIKVPSQCSAGTYSGVLSRIKSIFDEMEKICHVEHNEKEKERIRQETFNKKAKVLENFFTTPLTSKNETNTWKKLTFNKGGVHRLEIEITEQNLQNEKFYVSITGEYCKEDIQKLLDTVSGSLEYTMERLTK